MQAVIQPVDHFIDEWACGAVVDFIIIGVRTQLHQLLRDAGITANQNRNAIAVLFELDRSAQHDIFFGLGKNHALGFRARRLINLGERRCRRVLPRAQAGAIGLHIRNRLLRDARIHRGLGNGGGNNFHKARVERRRDDIIPAKFVHQATISRRDLFGHSFARQLRQRMCGGNLHRLVDGGCPHIQRTAKQEREAQDIVDLIGKIGTTRRNNRIRPRGPRCGRRDFGVGVRHRENDRLIRHGFHHIGAQGICRRKPQKHIRANNRFCERARAGLCGMRGFPLIHAFGPALIDDAFPVAHDDIIVRHAHALDQLSAGNCRSASAVANDLNVLQRLSGERARVDQPGGGNDRRAMLIIMKDRDVHPFFQCLFNDEAIGCGNIFQIDAAKGRFQQFNRVDEALRIFGIHFDVDGVDVGESFEQDCLAFHHWL